MGPTANVTAAIGNANPGRKGPRPVKPMSQGLDYGLKVKPTHVTLMETARTMDGGSISNFPYINTVTISESRVMQIESVNTSFDSLSAGASSFGFNAMLTSNFLSNFNFILDGIARQYANAQNLVLATPADFAVYINTYASALSKYLALISILNGDGFNDRISGLSQVLTSRRARIQTGYERLQQFPIPPGIVDLVARMCGCFAVAPAGNVFIHYAYAGSNNTPLDLTNGTSADSLLTECETQLAALLSNAESGLVRIVLAEYYGVPVPLPYPGVRMCRGLYDTFRLMAIQFNGVSNNFVWPWIENGANLVAFDGAVQVYIPRGYENDPLFTTFFRGPQPFGAYNNVIIANKGHFIGAFTGLNSGTQTNMREYAAGSTSSNFGTTGIPGSTFVYTNVMAEFYWAALAGASEVNASADVRPASEFARFTVNAGYLAQETARTQTNMLQGKARFPYPSDCTEYSTMNVKSR